MRNMGVPVPVPLTLYQMRPPGMASIASPGPSTGVDAVAESAAAVADAAAESADGALSAPQAARANRDDAKRMEDVLMT
jgi:hypothetical protein